MRTAPTLTGRFVRPLTAIAVLAAAPALALAQGGTNFGSAYQQMVRKRPDITYGTDQFLYNKYFRSNVAVSPYISGAMLGGTDMGTAYTTVVRGDVQRRENAMRAQAQYVQQRKAQGNIGYTAHPGQGYIGALPGSGGYGPPQPKQAPRTNGAYQNHWYGNWKR